MLKNDFKVSPVTEGGQMLQDIMREKELTFRDVGEEMGVNHTNVHHWITRRVPMLRWAVKLQELYGIPVESWMKDI